MLWKQLWLRWFAPKRRSGFFLAHVLSLLCLTINGVLHHEKVLENYIMTWKHSLRHKNTQIMWIMWMLGPDHGVDIFCSTQIKAAVTISLRSVDFIKPVTVSFQSLLNCSRENIYITVLKYRATTVDIYRPSRNKSPLELNSLPLLQIVMESTLDQFFFNTGSLDFQQLYSRHVPYLKLMDHI